MDPKKGRRTRRKYTQEFKDNAVRLILEGTPITQLAGKLGVDRCLLGRWRNQYLDRLEGKAGAEDLPLSPKQMAAEIADLRRQLGHSEQQREILKKALAIFSQDGRND